MSALSCSADSTSAIDIGLQLQLVVETGFPLALEHLRKRSVFDHDDAHRSRLGLWRSSPFDGLSAGAATDSG